MELLREFEGKNVLLLQSQFIFFWRLAKDLKGIAKSVHKINFNGGDWIFYPFGAVNYTGEPNRIGEFLIEYVKRHKIDAVVMFNDCKQVHSIAKRVLSDMVEIYVFEQGYIRPDFITFERDGVNGFSKIPKHPDFYRNLDIEPFSKISFKRVGKVSTQRFLYSLTYLIFFLLLKPLFRSSDFSVPNILRYAFGLIRGGIKGKFYEIIEKTKVSSYIKRNSGKYYFVPLQMSIDSQIKVHSPYRDVYGFIKDVLTSFSKHAPDDTFLVLKQHPFDIGLNRYDEFIRDLSTELKISNRVQYFKTGNIYSLISNSIGCVMINSTCGVTSIILGKPVIALGKAIYNIEGITYTGELDKFWRDAFTFKPDRELSEKFLSYIIKKTQINGSFYKKINKEYACGLSFIDSVNDMKIGSPGH